MGFFGVPGVQKIPAITRGLDHHPPGVFPAFGPSWYLHRHGSEPWPRWPFFGWAGNIDGILQEKWEVDGSPLVVCYRAMENGPLIKKRFPIDMVISNTGSDVRVPKGTRMSRFFYHELCCATGCSSPFRAGHSQLLTTRFLVVR